MILQATGARKPGPRGEYEGNRNTVARGMPECFGLPVVTTLVCFHFSHTRPRVRPSTRHSLRPLDRGASVVAAEPGRDFQRRGNAQTCHRERQCSNPKTGETVVPGLDRVKPAKDPTGVIARVSEATQSFLISQGDAASLHFGQLQIGHKGEFQFFGSRGKRICWRSAPLSAVVWHHRARRRPNEASACDASAC